MGNRLRSPLRRRGRFPGRGRFSGAVLALLVLPGAGRVPVPEGGRAPEPAARPEPPRACVETGYAFSSTRTLTVGKGGDLQEALDSAAPGDVIELEPGAVFRGPFTLPVKRGSGWIVVRTAVPDGVLPPPGKRVDPSHAHLMPKITARSGSAIRAEPGAHHYRFVGLEIRPEPGVFLYNLVQLGARETAEAHLPHHIILDRCYLHGDPRKGTRRGIAMNSRATAVIDSHVSDFKEVGADSQAIAGWNGPGPFKLVNNFLEGAGENVMFGGADPSIPDLVPADIEIRGNHFSKPLAWKAGEPDFAGTAWTVKNLFELKNARRVLLQGNLFEHNWVHAQNGFAILFTVRNQDGSAPWSTVEDVTFVDNVVRHSASGINILGRDRSWPSGSARTARIRIANNLFEEIGNPRWGGAGTLFQLLEGSRSVVIEHNTALQTGNIITAEGDAHEGFVFAANLVLHNANGVAGTGTGVGLPTLRAYFPGAVFGENILVGAPRALYPEGNFFPGSPEHVGFQDRTRGRYRLVESSPFRAAAPDRSDPGADFQGLCSALGSPREAPDAVLPRACAPS